MIKTKSNPRNSQNLLFFFIKSSVYRVQTPNPARVASPLITEKELESNAEELKYYEFLRTYNP